MKVKPRYTILAAAIVAMLFAATASADGPAKKRPLSDFLSMQGSQDTVLGVPNHFYWTAPPPGVKTPAPSYVGGNQGSCDYAGLANKWLVVTMGRRDLDLGTSFSGSLTERSLSDGRILLQLELHTTNALTYGLKVTTEPFGNPYTDPLTFGARAPDVLHGATPGIGECHFSVAWKQDPGPLADIVRPWDYPRFEFVNLSFRANASGPLRALAGYGPDGTPGRLFILQTGFYRTTFMGATADAFPAELVEVRAIGN